MLYAAFYIDHRTGLALQIPNTPEFLECRRVGVVHLTPQ